MFGSRMSSGGSGFAVGSGNFTPSKFSGGFSSQRAIDTANMQRERMLAQQAAQQPAVAPPMPQSYSRMASDSALPGRTGNDPSKVRFNQSRGLPMPQQGGVGVGPGNMIDVGNVSPLGGGGMPPTGGPGPLPQQQQRQMPPTMPPTGGPGPLPPAVQQAMQRREQVMPHRPNPMSLLSALYSQGRPMPRPDFGPQEFNTFPWMG